MQPDFAFYYPGQRFQNVDWIKNLICFFDGIAMLIPEDMPNYPNRYAEETMLALEDRELFRVIRPEEVVDQWATEALAEAFGKVIDSGRLDHLVKGGSGNAGSPAFDTLAKAKLGLHSDHELAYSIFQELRCRGLAYDLGGNVYIAVDKTVLVLILTLLAHILKPKGENLGITLSPATDKTDVVAALHEILEPESAPPTAGDVVSFDMDRVGINLNGIPMDEVLDFRKDNYSEHRDYILSVRKFARELSLMPPDERTARFEQRQEELKALSHDVKRRYSGSWKGRTFSFAIGVTGAAWNAFTGDPIAGAFTALAAVPALIPDQPTEIDVYSYLMSVRDLR